MAGNVRGPVLAEPLVGLVCVQPFDAVHAVALVVLHVRVEAAPLATDVGLADRVTVGTPLTGVTVTAAAVAVPPGPLQDRE